MKSRNFLIAVCLFLFCSNPVVNNDKIAVITCLNGISYLIRYNSYPQGKCPEYFTNEIKNNWTTLELKFNLNDTLKSISISPSKNDTLFLDTIWVEDNNNIMNTYTLVNIQPYDTTKQISLGWTGSAFGFKNIDIKTIASCPDPMSLDKTYSMEILFVYPIVSNGHVKIRIKENGL
jgi:hypothetical protein